MEAFVQRMVEEHAQLVTRVQSLNDYVYSDASDKDNKVEFANKCIQLAAMKKYEEALRARLENQNVVYTDGTYFEKVGKITQQVVQNSNPNKKEDIDFEGKDGK